MIAIQIPKQLHEACANTMGFDFCLDKSKFPSIAMHIMINSQNHLVDPTAGTASSRSCYTLSRLQLRVFGCGECPHGPDENSDWDTWECSRCSTSECNYQPPHAGATRADSSLGMLGVMVLLVLVVVVLQLLMD